MALSRTSTPSSLPRRAAAVSVVTNGLPVPRGQDDHAALCQVREGPAADERLGDLVHADRGHEPGLAAHALQRVLQGQAVDDGGRHAHVVGRRLLDDVGAPAQLGTAEDVAAADHDRELDAARRHARRLAGDPADLLDADAPLAGPAEALARELEQDAAEDGGPLPTLPFIGDSSDARGVVQQTSPAAARQVEPRPGCHRASAQRPSPTMNRANRATEMFSPVRALTSRIMSRTVLVSSLTNFWSSRTISPNQASSLPSAIFSRMFSGLSADLAHEDPLLLGDDILGHVLALHIAGLAAMTCRARSLASWRNSSLRATKSVSQLTSTITPDLPSWWM